MMSRSFSICYEPLPCVFVCVCMCVSEQACVCVCEMKDIVQVNEGGYRDGIL